MALQVIRFFTRCQNLAQRQYEIFYTTNSIFVRVVTFNGTPPQTECTIEDMGYSRPQQALSKAQACSIRAIRVEECESNGYVLNYVAFPTADASLQWPHQQHLPGLNPLNSNLKSVSDTIRITLNGPRPSSY
jgi:hypothetical protein